MQVSARQVGSVLILTLDGELLSPIAPAFLRTARRLLATSATPLIAVDLSRVPRVDASGFGALVSLLRDVERRQGGLCLVGIQPEVRVLLEIMQLHLLFEVCSDITEAVETLLVMPPARPGAARRADGSRGGTAPLQRQAAG